MAKRTTSPAFWRCMSKVKQILGEKLNDSELEELAKKLMGRAREIRAERYGMTADEAINKALKEMSEEAITQSRLKKRNTYLLNAAFARELGKIQTSWADDPRAGLTANYVGSNILRRGAQASIDADQKGLAHEWRNGFAADVERSGKRNLWRRGDLDLDAYKALGEMYKDNPNMTGIDRDAREFADIVYKWQETYRIAANNAGAFIKRIADYITHQNHDMFSVRTAAAKLGSVRDRFISKLKFDEAAHYKAWRDFVMPLLDTPRTFAGHQDPEKWLRHFWQNVATGEHLKAGTSTNSGFVAEGSLAGRLSEPRLLHFKDAESRFKYDTTFGRAKTLFERVGLQLEYGAHNVALMRRLGPNPSATHQRLKTAVRLLTEQSVAARLSTNWAIDERFMDAYFDELTGAAHLPGVSPTATMLRSARFLQTVSKLGAATLSSIADLAVAASELRYQGFSVTEAWKTQLDGVFMGYGKKGVVRAERMRLASELGVAIDYIRSATWSRFSAQDALPGWAARGQHFFFQANGLMWWTDTLRMANAQAMSHKVAMLADRAVPELDAGMQRLFTLFDVKPGEWDLMRSRAVDTVEGKEFFTPKGADRITDAEIAHLLQGEGLKATDRRVAERREQIRTKFRDIFAARSDYAVVVPGPRAQVRMRGANIGLQPGTTSAELARSAFQFKGFPASILERVWGREVFGYGPTGKVGDMGATGMGRLASFMLYSTFLGFVSLYLKSYFNGRQLKTPENSKDAATLFMTSFLQGGGAGLYGDFLFGQARDRFGHSALEAFLGPSAGMASDIYSSSREALRAPFDALYGDAKAGKLSAGKVFNGIKNNAPFVNLFYTRAALDYMFLYRLQEYFDPGSLKRMEDNYKKNQEQTFRLPPSQHYRPEDLTSQDIGKLLNPL